MPTKILVTRPNSEASCLIDKLNSGGFQAEYFPILSTKPIDFNIDTIQLQQVDKLLFSSPMSIQLMADWLVKTQFAGGIVVPGFQSYERIIQLNSRLNVVYPKKITGIAGVINENLLAKHDELIVFGGNQINSELADYCNEQLINFKFRQLYELANALQIAELLQLLRHNICYLIISSSSAARVLLEKINYLSAEELEILLLNLRIVSLHDRITRVFQRVDFKLIVHEINDMSEISIINYITRMIKIGE